MVKNNDEAVDQFDVMIVGSGPAGISTWFYLNKYAPELAANTLIIEKEKHPRDKLCGGALQNCFVDKFLNDVQISLDIPKIQINSVKVKYGDESFILQNESFLSIINRRIFDNYLVTIARKRGATIIENTAFTHFSHGKDCLYVKTTDDSYKIKILVGADGALSKIRNMISNGNEISYAKTLEVFTPVDLYKDSEYYGNFITLDWSCFQRGIQGYLWHFPCIIDNSAYLNHGIYHSRIRKPEKGNLIKEFLDELEKKDIHIPQSLWKSHPIPYFSNRKLLSDKRMLLVGDAAGIEPLIGGGIHLSLLYGDIAAQAIIDAYEKQDFSLSNYTNMVNNHVVGKFINNSIKMAKQVYSGKIDLLTTIQNNLKKMERFKGKGNK